MSTISSVTATFWTALRAPPDPRALTDNAPADRVTLSGGGSPEPALTYRHLSVGAAHAQGQVALQQKSWSQLEDTGPTEDTLHAPEQPPVGAGVPPDPG